MTTLRDRPNTALLVIDVQNGVVAKAHRRDETIATIRALVDEARRQEAPVVWIQHFDERLIEGDSASAIVPELIPSAGERVIKKTFGDAFENTVLEETLSELGAGRLIITGAQTDACIRSTLHGAFVRGYDTVLVKDAHTTEDLTQWGAPPPEQVIAHTNLYWTYQTAPGRIAGAVTAEDVDFLNAACQAPAQ